MKIFFQINVERNSKKSQKMTAAVKIDIKQSEKNWCLLLITFDWATLY